VIRLIGEALFVGRWRFGDFALIALPDAGHLPDCRRGGIQFFVRNSHRG
jgi:hypothetical protein